MPSRAVANRKTNRTHQAYNSLKGVSTQRYPVLCNSASLLNTHLAVACRMVLPIVGLLALGHAANAGTWFQVTNPAPAGINTMLLLSDGTVMAEGSSGAGANTWYKLTPNSKGSYLNGTWTTLASMHDTRLYFSSDVLPNGNVFVAGAEDGTGGSTAEIYNPLNNTWTYTPTAGVGFSDAISTTLPNGNVLDGPVAPNPSGSTLIYNYLANSWTTGPSYVRGGYQDEASWVKLADGSILTVDPFGTNSERYIPSLNQWVNDGIVPVALYDTNLGELGPAFLLPNGKAIFFGSTGHTAIYTPSGNTNPGSWAAGPDIPNGLGMPDAPGAMMANGVIVCCVGPAGTYNGPTTSFEYNWATNSFSSAMGVDNTTAPFATRMLDLPDGNLLYSNGSNILSEYVPSGSQIASGQPTVTDISPNADGSYQLVGYQLTGISEGAAYGDDAQMASGYPIVRITDTSGNVHYARTYNWSTTSVMQGSRVETTQFTVPAGLPSGRLQLQVVTNGISSNPVPFPTKQPLFFIYSNSSGKVVDLANGNTANQSPVEQWAYTYGSTHQYWTLTPTADGLHFEISPYLDTTKCFCISGGSTSNGAPTLIYTYVGNPDQQWDLIDVGNGLFNLRNVKSGLMLDLDSGSTANGAKIQQWQGNGGVNQQWYLQPFGGFYFRAAGGRYINCAGGGSGNGTAVIQYDFQTQPWFQWYFNHDKNGWFGIRNVNSNNQNLTECISTGSYSAGAPCDIWNDVGNPDQELRIEPKLDGRFKFYNALTGMSWDIPGGATGNSVPLDQYPDDTNPWQEFNMEPM